MRPSAVQSSLSREGTSATVNTTVMTPNLMNIASGYVASDTVNIHEVEAVGNTILHIMSGVQIESFDLMRKACVRQMPTTRRIRTPVGGGSGTPANLFNTELCLWRIMMSKQPIPDVFSFELSEYPTVLFSQGMRRRSGKARFGKSSVGQ